MTLEDFAVEKGAWADAAVLKTLVTMIRDKPKPDFGYGHGMTHEEVKHHFPQVIHKSLSVYDNKYRSLFKKGLVGKHDVPNHDNPSRGGLKKHYFPITLDEQGLIDHGRCVNCEKP